MILTSKPLSIAEPLQRWQHAYTTTAPHTEIVVRCVPPLLKKRGDKGKGKGKEVEGWETV